MNIQRFKKETADLAHSNTILASAFIPDGVKAPFDSAWGYLENHSEMEIHAHAAEEIYVVIKGRGVVMVGGEKQPVEAGDVIEIPPNAEHTMICQEEGPLLWAALWWKDQ